MVSLYGDALWRTFRVPFTDLSSSANICERFCLQSTMCDTYTRTHTPIVEITNFFLVSPLLLFAIQIMSAKLVVRSPPSIDNNTRNEMVTKERRRKTSFEILILLCSTENCRIDHLFCGSSERFAKNAKDELRVRNARLDPQKYVAQTKQRR